MLKSLVKNLLADRGLFGLLPVLAQLRKSLVVFSRTPGVTGARPGKGFIVAETIPLLSSKAPVPGIGFAEPVPLLGCCLQGFAGAGYPGLDTVVDRPLVELVVRLDFGKSLVLHFNHFRRLLREPVDVDLGIK